MLTHSGLETGCVKVMTLSVFFSGCILRLPIWGDAADDNCFDDEPYWEVRDESTKTFVQFETRMAISNHESVRILIPRPHMSV